MTTPAPTIESSQPNNETNESKDKAKIFYCNNSHCTTQKIIIYSLMWFSSVALFCTGTGVYYTEWNACVSNNKDCDIHKRTAGLIMLAGGFSSFFFCGICGAALLFFPARSTCK